MARDAAGHLVPNAQAKGTEIKAQLEQVGIGPDGRATNGYRVMFITGKGVPGSVWVPMALYNPQNVLAEVAQHAAQLDEVQGTVL